MAKDQIEFLINEISNFSEEIWNTPNTYSCNFKQVPKGPGIYMFVAYKSLFDHSCQPEVVYIGSSKNLYNRNASHNIKPLAERDYQYVRFYFKEILEGYLPIEIALIKALKPKYNLQHTRG
jgi:excinuclease UvrABC nuclease subunit